MDNKELKFGTDIRNEIAKGVELLEKAVSATMGPRGRNVIISDKFGMPKITKDGVSVAKEIKVENKFQNLGVQLVKEVASKTADEAGDGTTTATVLASSIFREGQKLLAAGANPIELKRGIDKVTRIVVEKLKEMSVEVTNDDIEKVATISANGDTEIGKLIAQAFDLVGRDGVISVDESKTLESYIEHVDGVQIKRGYLSPYFVNDEDKTKVNLKNAKIIIYNGKVQNMKELLPLLEQAIQQSLPVLLIADDIEPEVLNTLVVNKLRGAINIAAIKSPGFGEGKLAQLEDLAIATGGKVINPGLGDNLETFNFDDLGFAETITITKNNTTIIGGAAVPSDVKERIAKLKAEILEAKDSFTAEKLQERLAKLAGGVAIIKIGAASEVEYKEKYDRYDDAINATKAAIDEGVVIGGGCALLTISGQIANAELDGVSLDQQHGYDIVVKALEAPARKIISNAGYEAGTAVLQIQQGLLGQNVGFNAATGEFEDFMHSGVLDPTKVERVALTNAASIAGLLLTSEVGIVEIDDMSKLTPQQAAGLMNTGAL